MKHISLPVGSTRYLRVPGQSNVYWKSDNLNIEVRNAPGGVGRIRPRRDYLRPEGQAVISAINQHGQVVDQYEVTVVSWPAGNQIFEPFEHVGDYSNVLEVGDYLYAFKGTTVYRSTDGLDTVELVGEANIAPAYNNPILATPLGYFCRENGPNGSVYRSDDLLSWDLCYQTAVRGLYHGIDYHYDGENVIIYCGEYTVSNERGANVYRGIIQPNGEQDWSVVLRFYTRPEYEDDDTLVPKCRHIHTVQVDPYTGDVWVGTGDGARECHIYRSSDQGTTWQLVMGGDDPNAPHQHARTLAFWFTERYVYWNNDNTSDQHIWRIDRSKLEGQTPNEGLEQVYALVNGSHWYTCWATDEVGRRVIVMAQASEGQRRDWLNRAFAICELLDGSLDVQELIALRSSPDPQNAYAQLEPKLQDRHGNIYLTGRGIEPTGMWRARIARPYRPPEIVWTSPSVYV